MTRTIKLAMTAVLALAATSAFATNGDEMIGLGAKSTAMGGTGIAYSYGAESALTNPALISGDSVSFGGTYFTPFVKFKNEMTGMPTDYENSKSRRSVIPEVAVSTKVDDRFSWGIGMFGVAGMGVDYRNDTPLYGNPPSPSGLQSQYAGTMSGTNQMLTNLQIMRFAVPLAFTMSNFKFGFAPVIQYGSLDISYNNGAYFNSTSGPVNVMTGYGVSQDLGLGYELGAAYSIAGVNLGVVYKSAIDMNYKDQISKAAQNFGLFGFTDHLEQPAEIGVGIAYTLAGNTLAFDYKRIQWGGAKGYKDFGWEDQDVFAVGYQFAMTDWAVRLGYNYAKNPIKEQHAASMMTPGDYQGAAINFFNLAGFPAVVEQHFTVGGSYSFTKTIGLDLAYVYSPEIKVAYDTSAMTQAMAAAAGDPSAASYTSEASVKHSQSAVTVQITYDF